MPFISVSATEYNGPSRTNDISAPYTAMVAALGEPFKSTEPNYPDDDHKTDVCWCVRSTTRPRSIVTIWNYKNGPNYTHEGTIEDIDHFSVYQNDFALFEEVKSAIEQGIQPIQKPDPRAQLAACHEAIGAALALLRQEQVSAAMLVLDDALKGRK